MVKEMRWWKRIGSELRTERDECGSLKRMDGWRGRSNAGEEREDRSQIG